jgi:hypothetical protein
MTAEQVAAKLVPLGCQATPPAPSSGSISLGEIKPVTELECTISGEEVTIDEYMTAQQVAYNMGLAKGVGCTIAKQFGLTDLVWVEGANWTVSPKTTPTAEAIKNAINDGAKVVSVHC